MEASIHPTAIIEDGAQIDNDVTIGAYAYIGPEVILGRGTVVHHHASIEGRTEAGQFNEFFPYSYIGAKTQDKKFKGGRPGLKIGDHNVFREYATVHLATEDDHFTKMGDHNTVLAYSHIAHDCQIGNHMIMSSHAALGGHVIVNDHVNIGWGSGAHQFCRLGTHSMLGAASKLVRDLPPFFIADGTPAEVRTINKISLERSNFPSEDISLIRQIHRTLYREGLNLTQALNRLEEHPDFEKPIMQIVFNFAKNSDRGFA